MSTTTTSGQHSCPMMNFAPRAVAAFVSAGSLFLLLCLAQCQVCNGFHHQHQARIIGTRVPVGVLRRQHQRSSSTAGKTRPPSSSSSSPSSSPPLWEVGTAADRLLLPRRTDEHSLFLPLQLSRKDKSNDNEEEERLPTRGREGGFWGRTRFWRRRLLDPIESAGYDGDYVQAQGGIFGRIKRVHDPITYLAVALIAGLRMEWCFRNPYYWFGVGFCIKWFRARYVFKIPVWDRQPNWNNIITSKEQEKDLKAYTCKKCGSTIFIAKTREFFFEGSTGIGGLGCFSCGAKGKENFVMDRDRIVEDVADLDDYFEYERPLDFVSRAERRKLLKESGGDEEKANQLILERAAAAAAAEEEQQTKQQQEDDPLTILDATVIEEDTVVVETENKGEAAVVQSDDETVDQATDQEEEPEVAGSASSEAAAPPPADAAQSEIVMDAEIDATESSTVSDASKGTESAASATEKEESENASSDQEQQAVVKQGEISSSITPPPPPPPTPPVAENNNPASSSSSDNDDAQQEDDVSLDALGMDDF